MNLLYSTSMTPEKQKISKLEVVKFDGIGHPVNKDGTRTVFNWDDYKKDTIIELCRIPHKIIPVEATINGNWVLIATKDPEGNIIDASLAEVEIEKPL